MTTQHHSSFTSSILKTARRMFKPNRTHGLLAPTRIDARTARDIGINLVGLD